MALDHFHQPGPTGFIQLRHDIVKQQDRPFTRDLGQDGQFGDFERQNHRPLLTLGGVEPGVGSLEGNEQVVTVRALRGTAPEQVVLA